MAASKVITSASWWSAEIAYTVTSHWLEVWSSVIVKDCDPQWYNWTFKVKTVTDANHFVVTRVTNPGAFVSGWTATFAVSDKVFAVEDAIARVENTNIDHWTAEFTVCGTIQKNPSLPYNDAGTERRAAELSKVQSVNYSFSENRWFPTFEVTTTIKVIAIGDR
jgi:hypothetical protein